MNDQVKNVCKIGQGHDCCRYLMMGGLGFECAKGTATAAILDIRVLSESMTARGDNCDGKYNAELNTNESKE